MHIPACSLAFIEGLGGPEMVLIFFIILILFGGKKLPEFARGAGKAIREFKKATANVEEEIKQALAEPVPTHRPYTPPAPLMVAHPTPALTDSSTPTLASADAPTTPAPASTSAVEPVVELPAAALAHPTIPQPQGHLSPATPSTLPPASPSSVG